MRRGPEKGKRCFFTDTIDAVRKDDLIGKVLDVTLWQSLVKDLRSSLRKVGVSHSNVCVFFLASTIFIGQLVEYPTAHHKERKTKGVCSNQRWLR